MMKKIRPPFGHNKTSSGAPEDEREEVYQGRTSTQEESVPNAPRFIASLCGVGDAGFMPGTWGSLAASPPLLIMAFYGGLYWLLSVAVILIVVGWVVVEILRQQEDTQQGTSPWDPSWIVIDEAAGVALAFLPFALEPSLLAAILGFVLFRLLDTLKPPPIRQAEGLVGALGVMADDVVAGLLAAVFTAAFLFTLQALA